MVNNEDLITDNRIITVLESIEKSIRILAEAVSDHVDLKKQFIDNVTEFEKKMEELKKNPFGFKQTESNS